MWHLSWHRLTLRRPFLCIQSKFKWENYLCHPQTASCRSNIQLSQHPQKLHPPHTRDVSPPEKELTMMQLFQALCMSMRRGDVWSGMYRWSIVSRVFSSSSSASSNGSSFVELKHTKSMHCLYSYVSQCRCTCVTIWHLSYEYSILRIAQSALKFTFLTDLFTQTPSLGSIQPYVAINARRLLVHISTTVYSQVLIYTAEWTGAM